MEWGDIPHFALRTPGYPLFLAGCRAVLADSPLSARLVQAALGTTSVWLVYRLTRELTGRDGARSLPSGEHCPAPLWAAGLAAVHPYFIVMSVLLLSEAVFVPLMTAALWGLAVVWNRIANGLAQGSRREFVIASGVGLASGSAILVRPSWALFLPIMLAGFAWGLARVPARYRVNGIAVARVTATIVLGLLIVMGPWWFRNARIYGRFVPTAVWLGASLYDGLNPAATGASNMDFLSEPDVWPRDELDQDRELTHRAMEFVLRDPRRALELSLIKLGRYWSPWPSAEGFRSFPLVVASTVVVVPLLALQSLGLWRFRRDLRAWVLLAGPLLYFCALHMVFASSMRYRIPAEVPAMGLAAIGLLAIGRKEEGALQRSV
jgi:4-amino-4-deoxy-L-arabinose transferase-like glycosyltransferase